MPTRKRNRWGDGLDEPSKAEARNFFPDSYVPQTDVSKALEAFGHEVVDVRRVIKKGAKVAKELCANGNHFDAMHAAAVFAYTEEEPTDLYGKLNHACRTPGAKVLSLLFSFIFFSFSFFLLSSFLFFVF
jgi:hypothetical protein